MARHSLPIRIYYEDTDAGGLVYHANYLRYAERGRTEMLRDLGFAHSKLLHEHALGFVVRHVEIDYQRPAILDDMLSVQSEITRIGGASFDILQTIVRDDQVLCVIKVVIVCVNVKTGKAVRLPDEIRKLHKEEEGETVNV